MLNSARLWADTEWRISDDFSTNPFGNGPNGCALVLVVEAPRLEGLTLRLPGPRARKRERPSLLDAGAATEAELPWPFSTNMSLNKLEVCCAKSLSSELTFDKKSRDEEEVIVGER